MITTIDACANTQNVHINDGFYYWRTGKYTVRINKARSIKVNAREL